MKDIYSRNGVRVINRPRTHIPLDLEKIVVEILKEVVIDISKPYIEVTVDCKRPVGYVKVVKINSNDETFYAIRNGRSGYSKFVENREPVKSNLVTLVLKKSAEDRNKYLLITAYIGERVGPEPYDRHCKEVDRLFWSEHAFISEITDYDVSTVTVNLPNYRKINKDT